MLLFSHPVESDSLRPNGLQQPGLPVPHHLLKFAKFMSIASVVLSSHLTLWFPLLLLPSIFQIIRDFSSESAVCIRWSKLASGISLPKSIQDWFPLRLTGLISLLSKGLSEVSSSTTVQRHRFFDTLPSLWSSSHNCIWPLGRPEPCRLLSSYKGSEFSSVKNSIYEFSIPFWKLLKPFIKKHLHFT